MGVACFFGNVGELDFGGCDRLRYASDWGHFVDSYVDFIDVFNISFFDETVCCCPGVNYIYKIICLRYNVKSGFDLSFFRFNYTIHWRSSASVCWSRSAGVLDGSTGVI